MLTSQQITINDLVTLPTRLTLPTYQRDYTWEREHIEALLDDIENAIEVNGDQDGTAKYFLGNIILCTEAGLVDADTPNPDVNNRNKTFIVDGQQRLISLTLVYAALRDFLKTGPLAEALDNLIQDAATGSHRLHLRGADDALLKTHVQARGSMLVRIPTATVLATETAQCLIENRALVIRRIQNMSPADRVNFATFIIKHCVVISSVTHDVDYAFQIYLTLNNRGKRLAGEDILHGELIGPLADDERRRYSDILDSFGKYRRGLREPLKITRKTFFSHLVATLGGAQDQVIKPIRRAMKAAGGAHQFAETVFRPMADAYRIVMPRSTEREGLHARSQKALSHLDWFESHANDDYLSTAMLAVSILPHTSLELATVLERIDWLAHTLAVVHQGRKHRQGAFAAMNEALRNVRDGTVTIAAVLAVSPITQGQINKGYINLGRKLMELDKALCRLILVRIDAHLSNRPIEDYERFLDMQPDDPNAMTVEHIVPKGNTIKPAYRAAWLPAFPSDTHRLSLAEHLGNLAILGRRENTECDQKGFPAKKTVLFGTTARPRTHAFATTQALAALDDFTEVELAARHETFMAAVADIWAWGKKPTGSAASTATVTANVPAPKPKSRAGKKS